MSTETTKLTKDFGSITPYVTGFLLSLATTLASYMLVTSHIFDNTILLIVVLFLAFLQLIVQLLFFLHLGQEKQPRWNLYFFVATVGMMLLVIIGSIWIMDHLNYNMMPQQMDKMIILDEGIKK